MGFISFKDYRSSNKVKSDFWSPALQLSHFFLSIEKLLAFFSKPNGMAEVDRELYIF
jgi:hypothetical protein